MHRSMTRSLHGPQRNINAPLSTPVIITPLLQKGSVKGTGRKTGKDKSELQATAYKEKVILTEGDVDWEENGRCPAPPLCGRVMDPNREPKGDRHQSERCGRRRRPGEGKQSRMGMGGRGRPGIRLAAACIPGRLWVSEWMQLSGEERDLPRVGRLRAEMQRGAGRRRMDKPEGGASPGPGEVSRSPAGHGRRETEGEESAGERKGKGWRVEEEKPGVCEKG